LIPDRIDITKRPKVVEEGIRLGDWEGDTVHGQNAHLVTLVERISRFSPVKRVFSKTKEEITDAMIELFPKYIFSWPSHMRVGSEEPMRI
jgi:IS30 family transposase